MDTKRSLDAWKAECLRDYVRERMTPQEFAAHCGYALTNVYRILSRKTWTKIPVPEGFAYPWPERQHLGSRSRFLRRKEEYLSVITEVREGRLTKQEAAEKLNVSRQSVDDITRRLLRKGLLHD